MDKFIVTIFGIGYSKFAPGTLGSLFGILIFLLLYDFVSINPFILFFLIFFMFIIGWYFTFLYVFKNGKHDPAEIIIDEFLGQLISLIPIAYLNSFSIGSKYFFELLFFTFLLFRFFDILKPWPINIIDKAKSSLSILLDDVVAGLFSSIFTLILLLWLENSN